MIRKARAVWRGTGKDGDGDLTTDSGVLSQTPYSYKTRFENEKGTNPEELIAAAHAGCFTMALAFQLQAAGYTPTELTTEAAVTLEQEGQGFRITRSALTLTAAGNAQHRHHAGLQLLGVAEVFLRHALREILAALAVGVGGLHRHLEFLAGLVAHERLLEPRNQHAGADEEPRGVRLAGNDERVEVFVWFHRCMKGRDPDSA